MRGEEVIVVDSGQILVLTSFVDCLLAQKEDAKREEGQGLEDDDFQFEGERRRTEAETIESDDFGNDFGFERKEVARESQEGNQEKRNTRRMRHPRPLFCSLCV